MAHISADWHECSHCGGVFLVEFIRRSGIFSTERDKDCTMDFTALLQYADYADHFWLADGGVV